MDTILKGCGNAVGDDNMKLYAVTITPSPYKKHNYGDVIKKYMDMDKHYQECTIIAKIHEFDQKCLISYNVELTQKGSVHLHGVIRTDKIEEFDNHIVSVLGYKGRNNKKEDTVLSKWIHNLEGWLTYQKKEQKQLDESQKSYWFGSKEPSLN